ncbi:MAG: hypothetical protein ACI4TI_04185, partial [Christensenellales bacterium]
ELHSAIDFTERSFVLMSDLDLSNCTNLLTFDSFNYVQNTNAQGKNLYYNASTQALEEETDDILNGNGEYYETWLVPSFVNNMAGKYLIQSGLLAFNGKIVGQNHTIKTKDNLFDELGVDAVVQDLTIKNTNQVISRNLLDNQTVAGINYVLSTFGVALNRGTIKNVNVVCEKDIRFETSLNYADIVSVKTKKDGETKIKEFVGDIAFETGLVVARNYGKIENCSVEISQSEQILLSHKLLLDYAVKQTSIQKGENSYYNLNDLTKNLKLSVDSALIVGRNLGLVSKISLKNKILCENGVVVGLNNIAQGGDAVKPENISKTSLNLGLISAENDFDSEYSLKNKDGEANVSNIVLTDCGITNNITDFASTNIGAVSGKSLLGFDKCYVFNQTIANTKAGAIVGMIVGLISPTVYQKQLTYSNGGNLDTLTYFVPFVAKISDCVATIFGSNKLVGSARQLKLAWETATIEGNEVKVCFLYAENNTGGFDNTGIGITYYFAGEITSIPAGGTEENGYGALNYEDKNGDGKYTDTEITIETSVTENRDLFEAKVENIVAGASSSGAKFEGTVNNPENFQIVTEVTFTVAGQTVVQDFADGRVVAYTDSIDSSINTKCKFMAENVEWTYCTGDNFRTFETNNVKIVYSLTDVKSENKEVDGVTYKFVRTFKVTSEWTMKDENGNAVNFENIVVNFIDGQELSQLTVPNGFSFVEANEVVQEGKTYHLKYSFTINEQNYVVTNILVTLSKVTE